MVVNFYDGNFVSLCVGSRSVEDVRKRCALDRKSHSHCLDRENALIVLADEMKDDSERVLWFDGMTKNVDTMCRTHVTRFDVYELNGCKTLVFLLTPASSDIYCLGIFKARWEIESNVINE